VAGSGFLFSNGVSAIGEGLGIDFNSSTTTMCRGCSGGGV